MNVFHLGEGTQGKYFHLSRVFLPLFREKKKMQSERAFHVMSADISNFLFMTSQKDIVSKVLFSWKKKSPKNYRFTRYKVCGFWKMQEQQNILHLAAILVGHKEFLEASFFVIKSNFC